MFLKNKKARTFALLSESAELNWPFYLVFAPSDPCTFRCSMSENSQRPPDDKERCHIFEWQFMVYKSFCVKVFVM